MPINVGLVIVYGEADRWIGIGIVLESSHENIEGDFKTAFAFGILQAGCMWPLKRPSDFLILFFIG